MHHSNKTISLNLKSCHSRAYGAEEAHRTNLQRRKKASKVNNKRTDVVSRQVKQ
ncbi:MAG: hypothetical protein QS748_14615 [Candidatus Endonucleobacter bathymodioli]|uniref:Uncharacterized protein n=1 Tax=Candidatus Endonucleibacter bathymodioli TaxID=539814 RepID=A0AA90P1C7_9GAMM|nr:hypothetical protein [Candidatus Endonucleobacter bathymodioli]